MTFANAKGDPEPCFETVLLIGGPAAAYRVTIPEGVDEIHVPAGPKGEARVRYVRKRFGGTVVFAWEGLGDCQLFPLLLTAYARKRTGKENKVHEYLARVATITKEEIVDILAGRLTPEIGAKLVPPAGSEDLIGTVVRFREAAKEITEDERIRVSEVLEALGNITPPQFITT